jgi:hypothetical protein
VFYLGVCACFAMVSSVFVIVSDACFKCFICLQTYISSVAYEYFKSRTGVASPSSSYVVLSWCLLLLPIPARHPPPPPLLLDIGDVRSDVGLCGRTKRHGKGILGMGVRTSCPFGR